MEENIENRRNTILMACFDLIIYFFENHYWQLYQIMRDE